MLDEKVKKKKEKFGILLGVLIIYTLFDFLLGLHDLPRL